MILISYACWFWSSVLLARHIYDKTLPTYKIIIEPWALEFERAAQRHIDRARMIGPGRTSMLFDSPNFALQGVLQR